MRILAFALLAVWMQSTDGCEPNPTADTKQASATKAMAGEADRQAGMPGISNFTERKLVKKLYELRDQEISTYTYVPALDGKLYHLCDSIGFGVPYGVQYTNPERVINWPSGGYGLIPQPEPNGLFMPSTAEGTWVNCASKAGQFKPTYVEPRVIVTTFPLNSAGEYQRSN